MGDSLIVFLKFFVPIVEESLENYIVVWLFYRGIFLISNFFFFFLSLRFPLSHSLFFGNLLIVLLRNICKFTWCIYF